jgi:antibiotic biosynthesis monooxygenase (ABM) superfamily enzyme
MFPEHVFTVRATVDAEHETEFNRWYDEEHVPDFLEWFPACVGAARYKVLEGDGTHQYLAVYAFESAEAAQAVMGSEALKEMVRRYDEAVGAFSTRSRVIYTKVLERGR